MSKSHEPTKQCQPIVKTIEKNVAREREYIHTKHENLVSFVMVRKSSQMASCCNPLPNMGATEEVDSHGT